MDSENVASYKSSIPRPSKLPVLNKRSSQLPFPKSNGLPELAISTTSTPTLGKRRSVASFSRNDSNNTRPPSSTSQHNVSNGSISKAARPPLRTSTSSHTSTVRPSSRGNQQRAAPPHAKKSTTVGEDEENHDKLSSLDSFRSASRQGSQDESAAELDEPVLPSHAAPSFKAKKSSRPSLSDRTIESLQGLPTTPKERRRSSFFSPGQMGPPPRPSSSLSRNGSSGGSRPGTSDGNFGQLSGLSAAKRGTASAKPATRASLGGFGFTPARSTSASSFGTRTDSKTSVPPSSLRSPSPSKRSVPTLSDSRAPKLPRGSKTVAARPLKPRPSIKGMFDEAVKDTADDATGRKSGPEANANSTRSPKGANATNASSAALRQQIAAAKAAARKGKMKAEVQSATSESAPAGEVEFERDIDPFNQAPRDEKHILRHRINAARMDGRLNIAAMGFKQIPDDVMKMYESAAMESSNVNWAEVVDLTKFIAADNEIEALGNDIFPDVSADDLVANDHVQGSQFGGLEMFDVHNNQLRTIPMGLRRLERLTSVNLAHNGLENDALDVLSQVSSLKDLRLGHNNLSGSLPSALCGLQHLETLDVQANRLLGLPEALRELVSLKVLNVSRNQLTALPMDAVESLPLRELDASSNALIGSLFPPTGSSSHPSLQTLRVANNSLAALTFSETLELPRLRTLDVTNNHLTSLPDISTWSELITLTAGDNKITQVPDGFTRLRALRNVNFTSNELRLLDPSIAGMEALESLILASNPLRDKKFLTMSAADIKRDLRSRLAPPSHEDGDGTEQEDFHDARDSFSPSLYSPRTSWSMQANGRLDLSGRAYGDAINDGLGAFLKSNDVKQLFLCSNKISAVPPALWLGQELKLLDLSGNSLGIDYLSDDLSLPTLQELNMSRCNIVTFEPLLTHLRAPCLQTLNVAINRLTGALPILRQVYPALTTFLANDNKVVALNAESLRGLHVVNLSGNNIDQLPAEVGLLWDDGLRSLEISGNAFRVPSYRVLEKGTEAVLKYLRDKLPEAQRVAAANGLADAGT